MSTLPLHPAIVHLPLGLAFVVPLLAIGLLVAHRRRALPRAAFAILVGAQALLVAGGVVAMQLGDRDAKRVEPIAGEAVVETHEERAEVFVWTAGAVLAGTVAILLVPAGAVTITASVVAAATLAVAGLALAVGEAGGRIVYQNGGATAFSAGAGQGRAVAGELRGRDGDDD
jgi:uncharacterized membrane protein